MLALSPLGSAGMYSNLIQKYHSTNIFSHEQYGKSIPNKVSIELKLHYHISCLPHMQLDIDSLLLGDTTQEH